jgi:peptidoglycan/LPS O-acetylase OafA/YrhL
LITEETFPIAARPPPDASAAIPRLHFIDGLRGLAMLLVLVYHCRLFGGQWAMTVPLGDHAVSVGPLLGYGHVGVNLFLVLSGFCLYWPFVKSSRRREPTLWEFAKKRCIRILPPYYAALVLFGGAAFASALLRHDPSGTAYALNWIWIHAVMAQNLRPGYVLTLDGSLWSLALEFQLYILFPVLVEAYRRFQARGVIWTVLIVCSAYRFFLVRGHFLPDDATGYVLAYSVFGRGFEFALGMFTAMLLARRNEAQKRLLHPMDFLAFAGIASAAVLDGRHGHFQTLTDVLWGLLFAALILAGSRTGTALNRALSSRFLVSLGLFSYSVYLIHLPLVILLGRYALGHFSGTGQALFMLLFTAPLMLGLGYLFHLLFERPFLTGRAAFRPAEFLR